MHSVREEWRPVRGHEGDYEVSDQGRVRSLGRDMVRRDGVRYVMPERVLSAWLTRGYPTVALSRGGKVRKEYVNRLVADAFLPEAADKPTVNHIDADPLNNRVGNLEWVTQGDNVRHATRLGLRTAPRGEAAHFSKLTPEQVAEIRSLYPKCSGPQLAKRYSVSAHAIYAIVNRKSWRHVP